MTGRLTRTEVRRATRELEQVRHLLEDQAALLRAVVTARRSGPESAAPQAGVSPPSTRDRPGEAQEDKG